MDNLVDEIIKGRKTFFIAPDRSLLPQGLLEECLTMGYECYFIDNDIFLSIETKVEIILSIFSFLLNFLLIVFSAILIKFPQKLFLIGIEALAYSLGMSIFDSEAIMSLLMLCVTFSTLLLRGNFNNNKKKILLTFIILYLFELLIPLRQGFEIFINVFFQKIGTTILLGIIGFFSFEYCKQIFSMLASGDFNHYESGENRQN